MEDACGIAPQGRTERAPRGSSSERELECTTMVTERAPRGPSSERELTCTSTVAERAPRGSSSERELTCNPDLYENPSKKVKSSDSMLNAAAFAAASVQTAGPAKTPLALSHWVNQCWLVEILSGHQHQLDIWPHRERCSWSSLLAKPGSHRPLKRPAAWSTYR